MSNINGYYRYPTVFNNEVVFVAENNLWKISIDGGLAVRLTNNIGEITHPYFSNNGQYIAFVGKDEGHTEIYIISSNGGAEKRLTYLGSSVTVVGWHNDKIIFASNHLQPFRRIYELYELDITTGQIEKIHVGYARSIAFGEKGIILGRNTGDPARWKRYRGGTAGELWIGDRDYKSFRKLINIKGNLANPMWIGERIYFISDHENTGNIYSCLPDGTDLKKHTFHDDYFARNATTDGKHIVYHCGANIYKLNIDTNKNAQIEVEFFPSLKERSRKFVDPSKYLQYYKLSEDGSLLAVITRGKPFIMGNWEGATIQLGKSHGVRYKHIDWLDNDKKIVVTSDEGSKYHIELYDAKKYKLIKKITDIDIGIPQKMKSSPNANKILLTTHSQKLLMIDLDKEKVTEIEQNQYGQIEGFNWSPDGNWVVYESPINIRQIIIKIYDVKKKKSMAITTPLLQDTQPVFDPNGKYIYFLSKRLYNPVSDNLNFDLGFPEGMKPYVIVLQKDEMSPFILKPHSFEDKKDDHKEDDNKDNKRNKRNIVKIDFKGIENRIIPFAVSEGLYHEIDATKDKVFFSCSYPVGLLNSEEEDYTATLYAFDMKTLENNEFLDDISSFSLSKDKSTIICKVKDGLRVFPSNKNPKEDISYDKNCNRETGWIDLNRVHLKIDPLQEWKQMFREAWLLQKCYFWRADMNNVDWDRVYKLYYPLIDRVISRSEFSDLIWEMQGELGTSHCYEFGGDYKLPPQYKIGSLCATFQYDKNKQAYRIQNIGNGDVWSDTNYSPLRQPGVNIKENDLLFAINGQKLTENYSPNEALLNLVDSFIELTVGDAAGKHKRNVIVKTVKSDIHVRYRDWVEKNRTYVHKKGKNKIGYIHIPDMGINGYAEFHRYFLMELDYEGLIIDVRFNGGGFVSQLLLEKLARKRIGYDQTRWSGIVPYPMEAPHDVLVAITNEHAGSDGDIFSHAFKLMKLGKLIGKRTWGGVIGIWPRNWLVDGTITTQPEFSFWFKDAGWGVENYGTDPDIEIEILPNDYANGIDTQLDKAIEIVLSGLKRK